MPVVDIIQNIESRVLFEDNHLLVVNKLATEIVQDDKTGDTSLFDNVKEYIRTKYKKPGDAFLGVVHRLDRPVSGALIFAKTTKALQRLNKMLQERRIKKAYWAVVRERPPFIEQELRHYIRRNTKQNKAYIYDKEVKDSQLAVLDYKLIAESDNHFLLEINLQTGRHHQIRAQLAHIGCPIRGDLKYGFARSNPGGFIHLHARDIEFQHPVSKELITITAACPTDPLWDHFNKITI